MTRRKKPAGDYELGYGKPPVARRFRKGQCGNPGGRPRGMTAGRAKALVLKEAYRPITLREGDNVVTLPMFQVVLRSLIASAVKGNGPAQRAVIEAVQAVERELSAQAITESANTPSLTNIEAARRIAFVFARAERERKKKNEPER